MIWIQNIENGKLTCKLLGISCLFAFTKPAEVWTEVAMVARVILWEEDMKMRIPIRSFIYKQIKNCKNATNPRKTCSYTKNENVPTTTRLGTFFGRKVLSAVLALFWSSRPIWAIKPWDTNKLKLFINNFSNCTFLSYNLIVLYFKFLPLWIGAAGLFWFRDHDGTMNSSTFGRPGSTFQWNISKMNWKKILFSKNVFIRKMLRVLANGQNNFVSSCS